MKKVKDCIDVLVEFALKDSIKQIEKNRKKLAEMLFGDLE